MNFIICIKKVKSESNYVIDPFRHFYINGFSYRMEWELKVLLGLMEKKYVNTILSLKYIDIIL